MVDQSEKRGARIFFFDDGVVHVKLTIYDPKMRRYVIEMDEEGAHKQKFVEPGDDQILGEVVRQAGRGELPAYKGRA
ncbi:MAG: hypothetical protein V3U79_04000 [Dehalococcoidia bacterium]